MNSTDTQWTGVTLHFLRGLPRSGKSTLAAKLVDTYKGVIVSADSLRIAVFNAQFSQYHNKEVYKTLFTMVKALVYSGHKYIILDGAYCKAEYIDEVLNACVPIDSVAEITVKTSFVNTDPATCIQRAVDAKQGMGVCRAIVRMHQSADWHLPYEYNKPTGAVARYLKGGNE